MQKHQHWMHLWFAVFVAAMAFLVVPGARAFTIETKNTNNSDGSQKFTDPDEKVERFGSGNSTTQQGNPTFHFEVRPSYGAFGAPQRDWVNPMQNNGLLRNDR